MNTLKIITIKNAFGIRNISLNAACGNGENGLKNVVIYAPNGTFKTSFALIFKSIQTGEEIKDRLTGAKGTVKCKIGNKEITQEVANKHIIIFSRNAMDDIDFDDSIGSELSMIASVNYKVDEIKKLHNEIDEIEKEILGVASSFGLKKDILEDLLLINGKVSSDKVENYIQLISDAYEIEACDKIDFKKINSKTYQILDDVDFQKNIEHYKNILVGETGDDLFKGGFSIKNATSFIKNVKNSNFLSKENKRSIKIGDIEYFEIEKLEKFFNVKINNISTTQEAIEIYEKINKNIGTSNEAESFKKRLKEDIEFIQVISHTRKDIILSKLKKELSLKKFNFEEKIVSIKTIKSKLEEIAKEASKEENKFKKAIAIFKKRFNPVFDLKIENENDVYINKSVPKIKFIHKCAQSKETDYKQMVGILSSGERTALNVIKFIVKYMNVKDNKPVIILDDVVETFDYGNRYAFIRYIQDLKTDGANIIVLTNNFDFYNNVYKRAELTYLSALPNTNRDKIIVDQNKKIFFDVKTIFKEINTQKVIAYLPFAREISKLRYMKELNSFFHYNKKALSVSMKDLIDVMESSIHNILIEGKIGHPLYDETKKYIDILYEECNSITKFNKIKYFDLIAKIVLSLGIRIKCEQLIINEDFSKIKDIKSNQTRVLFEQYKNQFNEKFLNLMESILVSTPEFMHLNAFMYEPLIDIDPKILIEIYLELSNYNPESIWKREISKNNDIKES